MHARWPDPDHAVVMTTLPDGRRIAHTEWGDPAGSPVIHMHGLPGSRLEIHTEPGFYAAAGVRFITVDRPGYGQSDPDPDGTLVSWAEDVEALADDIGLDRFGITAMSGGGPFGLAAAHRLGERIVAVALAGSMGPLDSPGAFSGIKMLNRLGIWAAGHFKTGLYLTYASMRLVLQRSPDLFFREMANGRPAGDRSLLARGSLRRRAEVMLLEASRAGVGGAVHEVGLLARPWGFAPSEITQDVYIYHGRQDDTAPLRHAMRLAAEIPHSHLRICEGEGHMVMWTHVAEILAAATGRLLPIPAPTPARAARAALRVGALRPWSAGAGAVSVGVEVTEE